MRDFPSTLPRLVFFLLLFPTSCMAPPQEAPRADSHSLDADAMAVVEQARSVRWPALGERVPDFTRFVPTPAYAIPRDLPPPCRRLERVTTAVPWPRGLAWVDGNLVVLARGRHRRHGGVDPALDDRCGSLFLVDPDVSETVAPGEPPSEPVRSNARLLAAPDPEVTHLPDGALPPLQDYLMERPYCTLAYDPVSRNLFLCGYSGVDLPGGKFRKNATDSILRYDLRVGRWFLVERHDPASVPSEQLARTAPNDAYPHADPRTTDPPHGWLNGPDGCTVVGDFLYACGKDNHLVVRYDLSEIRRDPEAPPPPGRPVLGPRVRLRHPRGEDDVELLGPSALAASEGYLYVGYRTSSVVVRYRVDARGRVTDPGVADLVAVFRPFDPATGKAANLIDMAFDPFGRLFVSCASRGRVWCLGVPDPDHPILAVEEPDRPASALPFLDLPALLGRSAHCGNILFDPRGRLYVASGAKDDPDGPMRGVVYRATPAPPGGKVSVR